MMQKIQRFGGAMFTPILLFAFPGIMLGIGTLCQTEAIFGALAAQDSFWYQMWYVIREGAWTVIRQMPVLFVIALPIGLAKKQNARACMEAFVIYMTFNYMLSAMLSNWGGSWGVDFAQEVGNGTGLTLIGSVKTLDTGMIGSLIIAGIAVYLHNRFFDTKLPEWLGTFKGSSFVCMIGFIVMIPMALVFMMIWPKVQSGIIDLQSFFQSTGYVGIWIYSFLERILIPTGLHHFVYMPFLYDSAVIADGVRVAWAEQLSTLASTSGNLAELFPAGGYALSGLSKMFAPIGVTAAFYATARPEKKKAVLGLMIPVALTSAFAGISEPIEFTFLFIAPLLFVVHAVLSATLCTIEFMMGVSGDFCSGILQSAALNWIPLGGKHMMTYAIQFGVGFIFSFIWYIVFKFLILKFDFKTPGRESNDEETKLISKAEYKKIKQNQKSLNDVESKEDALSEEAKKAIRFLEAMGGKDNIADVTNCATRLRVTLKDDALLSSVEVFKKAGAHGLVHKGKAIQVIVGMSVPVVRDEFEKLL